MRKEIENSGLLLPTLALVEEARQSQTPYLIPHALVTAEIIYCLPDHPLLLQTFLWQDYDHAPRFPVFSKFISFWQREIEGKIHTVHIAARDSIQPVEFQFYAKEHTLH